MQYLIIFTGPNIKPELQAKIHPLAKSLSGIPNTLVLSTGASEESTVEMNRKTVMKLIGKNNPTQTMLAYAGDNTKFATGLMCHSINMASPAFEKDPAIFLRKFLEGEDFFSERHN